MANEINVENPITIIPLIHGVITGISSTSQTRRGGMVLPIARTYVSNPLYSAPNKRLLRESMIPPDSLRGSPVR